MSLRQTRRNALKEKKEILKQKYNSDEFILLAAQVCEESAKDGYLEYSGTLKGLVGDYDLNEAYEYISLKTRLALRGKGIAFLKDDDGECYFKW